MCESCFYNPCVSGCPNAPEPPAFYKCSYCKEDITEGEEYYEYDERRYHDDCFRECAVELLLESGAEKKTAKEEEPDYDPYDD